MMLSERKMLKMLFSHLLFISHRLDSFLSRSLRCAGSTDSETSQCEKHVRRDEGEWEGGGAIRKLNGDEKVEGAREMQFVE